MNSESTATDQKSQPSGPSHVGGSSTSSLKRSASGDNQHPAKKRALPSSWNESQSSIASYSSSRTLSASASVNSVSRTTLSVTSATKTAANPTPIPLSAEQKHILKLAKDGESLFYTGSAGECLVVDGVLPVAPVSY